SGGKDLDIEMKRDFCEISDDEWGDTTVKLSRVIKRSTHENLISNGNCQKKDNKVLPPVESFAFKQKNREATVEPQISDHLLEDDDFQLAKGRSNGNRGRRFVVADESDEEFDPAIDKDCNVLYSPIDENRSVRMGAQCVEILDEELADENMEAAEDDVVGNALQKCGQIAVTLREELSGSGSTTNNVCYDRYAEVDAAAAKLVTQGDIDAACNVSDFSLQPILKPYQLVGVNFLLLLHRKKIGGAILADEMGLGKTVQAITFLAMLKHLDNDPGPHLIVSPASLLENWERELQKWCPSFSVIQFHGTGRAALSKRLNYLAKAGGPAPFNVLLVCYSLFERHSAQQKDDRKVLKRWRWSCVLMDEAHVLKDRGSYRRKNLLHVAQNAKQRLMLTGTPLQNDLEELWSLLEFMMPNIFETGDVDLKKVLGASAEDTDLITRIKSILGPFILRRLKSDVMQQLAQKTQKVEFLRMIPEQADAYKEAIEEYRAASLARLAKNTGSAVENVADFLPRRQISNYFMQFRKIANHPLLARRLYTDSDVDSLARKLHPRGTFGYECTLERVREELLGYNDFSLHQLSLSHGGVGSRGTLDDRHALCSAKCQALSELLPVLHREGHRALIFSQWTSMLDILEWALDTIGMTYRRLDGSTQVSERQTIVDTFNNDPTIFACLLSTRAGGQGLNLIGADTVIIHDMDFNPQMDRQAEDRCHRIGQTKPVTVYRLVTKGTVDENIYEIAKRKLVLDAAVLESGVEIANESDSDARTMGEILAAILASASS
ncbi:hypothetical protein KI387_032124, partial [Taxus chinensis]